MALYDVNKFIPVLNVLNIMNVKWPKSIVGSQNNTSGIHTFTRQHQQQQQQQPKMKSKNGKEFRSCYFLLSFAWVDVFFLFKYF